jgi:hypothetical protein
MSNTPRDDLEPLRQRSFGILASLDKAWEDALLRQKGDMLVEACASLLMYLLASEEERQDCREAVDRLRRRLVTMEDVQAGVLGPPLSRRVDHVQSRVDEIAKIVEELSAKKLRVRRRLAEGPRRRIKYDPRKQRIRAGGRTEPEPRGRG